MTTALRPQELPKGKSLDHSMMAPQMSNGSIVNNNKTFETRLNKRSDELNTPKEMPVKKVKPPLRLDKTIHARDCRYGQMALLDYEYEKIQALILPLCFRLSECATPISSNKRVSSKSRHSLVSRRTVQELEMLNAACDASVPGKRRLKKFNSRYEDSIPSRELSKAIRSTIGSQDLCGTLHSAKSDISGKHGKHDKKKRQKDADSSVKNSDIEKYFRNNPSTWQSACYRIMQSLKVHKCAKWFLSPVDPEADGVPDYFNVVKKPMDLRSVELKLYNNAYIHPFLWQQDMRLIFYNAFSYHPISNEVWKDATTLAFEFERLCKSTGAVNPYGETLLSSITHVDLNHRKDLHSKPHHSASSHTSKQRHESSRSDMKSSKGEMSRVTKTKYVSKRTPLKRQAESSVISQLLEQFFQESAPIDAPVLPPPPVPRIGVNDKPLSASQKRTLENHMHLLGPKQRCAALELIQDDLGISAADHMCDEAFTFDTELLSIEKQKRLFAYVNSMVRENREMFLSKHRAEIEAESNYKRQKASQYMSTSSGGAFPVPPPHESSDDSSSDSLSSSTTSSSSSTSSSTCSSDSEMDSPSSKGGGKVHPGQYSKSNSIDNNTRMHSKSSGLPEYRPVTEDGERMQIREEVMGHQSVDFLGIIDANADDSSSVGGPKDVKSTAWQEWKGQVIQQGFVLEHSSKPQRSANEIIAEGYDARI